MTPTQKRALILEPLASQLEPYGFFLKSHCLWKVNLQEKYIISMYVDLSLKGNYLDAHLNMMSFFEDIMVHRNGMPNMYSVVSYYHHRVIPHLRSSHALHEEGRAADPVLDLYFTSDYDHIDQVCIAQAADIVEWFESYLPTLKQIDSFADYKHAFDIIVQENDRLQFVRSFWNDVATNDFNQALVHIEQSYKEVVARGFEAQIEMYTNKCSVLREMLNTMTATDWEKLFADRNQKTMDMLKAYLGSRRWRALGGE